MVGADEPGTLACVRALQALRCAIAIQVEWTGKALQDVPNHTASLRYRAASLGLLGRLEEGRQVVRPLLELVPDFTVARARRHLQDPGCRRLLLRRSQALGRFPMSAA